MQSTYAAAMLQLRVIWSDDDSYLSVKVASYFATFICWWPIIVGNDSMEGNMLGSCKLHMY
eukprot:scaffold2007_cov131-Skeletonema_menzelii.AAC.2